MEAEEDEDVIFVSGKFAGVEGAIGSVKQGLSRDGSLGHAHWYPPGLRRQRWVHHPLLFAHGLEPENDMKGTVPEVDFKKPVNLGSETTILNL